MKIAILTLPFGANYGGLLQGYALQTVLERMGHEVWHLQPKVCYPPLHPMWKMPMVWCKRCCRKFFGGEWKLPVFEHPVRWSRKNTDAFIAQFLHCRYLQKEEWTDVLAEQYDVIIVGSDQVWRAAYASPLSRFFADFANSTSVKRISYAASFGVSPCDFTPDQIAFCKSLLSDFYAISVREKSGISICADTFCVKACHVLDPTMLLDKNDYLQLISRTKKSSGSLMTYVLDETPTANAFIKKMAKAKGLKPFRANSKIEDIEAKMSQRQQPPVGQWLRSFLDSNLVITDSFHCCVFSILFQKDFVCIGNKSRGMSRFRSLLEQFQLQDRLVSLDMPLNDRVLDGQIDWEKVNKVLDNLRSDSMSFLQKALA